MLQDYEILNVDMDGLFEELGKCNNLYLSLTSPGPVTSGSPIIAQKCYTYDKTKMINTLELFATKVSDYRTFIIKKGKDITLLNANEIINGAYNTD